jgi:hypothetical protein
MQQNQQIFQLTDLTGQEIEAIMVGLNELPSKTSRTVMNKLEGQIVQQVQAQNAAQALANKPVPVREQPAEQIKAGLSDED